MSLPTFHFVEVETTDFESRKAADAENASRTAVVEVTQQSQGVGQHRLPHPIVFPVIFRTEPHFTCGSAVVQGPADGFFHDPRGTSGVYAWVRNKRGYYTGALCWVRVDVEQIATGITTSSSQLLGIQQAVSKKQRQLLFRQAVAALKASQASLDLNKVVVEHHMTFSAIAIKSLPTNKLTSSLNPRTVGI